MKVLNNSKQRLILSERPFLPLLFCVVIPALVTAYGYMLFGDSSLSIKLTIFGLSIGFLFLGNYFVLSTHVVFDSDIGNVSVTKRRQIIFPKIEQKEVPLESVKTVVLHEDKDLEGPKFYTKLLSTCGDIILSEALRRKSHMESISVIKNWLTSNNIRVT